MNPDGSSQSVLDPRGSILSTGEIDPVTASTLGRLLVDESAEGVISEALLTRLQQAGDEGLFRSLAAAYIRWIAQQGVAVVRGKHGVLTAEIRKRIELKGAHARHADIVAQLVAAYRLFMDFVVERNLLAQVAADANVVTVENLLKELGQDQAAAQQQAKPGRQFLNLIMAAIQSEQYHLLDCDSDQAPAEYEHDCGWRADPLPPKQPGQEDPKPVWRIPAGSRGIGFISIRKELVYLDPELCDLAVTDMAKRMNNPQSFNSVGRELLNEGLVKVHSNGDKRAATGDVRIRQSKKKRYWVPFEAMFGGIMV
jgi:hypothetical protein